MPKMGPEKPPADFPARDAGWEDSDRVSDAQLWEVLREMRSRLVDDVRDRLRKSWQERGARPAELGLIVGVLDPDVLSFGFAIRDSSNKRCTLLFRQRIRL